MNTSRKMAPFTISAYSVCILAAASLAVPSYHQPKSGHDSAAAYEENTPRSYRFAFSSDDTEANQRREEHSDQEGNVHGSYSFSLPDGTKRRVRYIADEGGFRAKIESNEHGFEAKNPADVKVMVSENAALNQDWSSAQQSWNGNSRSEALQNGWVPQSASAEQRWQEPTAAVKQGWSDNSNDSGFDTPRSQAQLGWSKTSSRQQGWSDQTARLVQSQGWSDSRSAQQKTPEWTSKSAAIRKESWPSKSARQSQGWSDDSASAPIQDAGWTDNRSGSLKKQDWSPKSSALKSRWSDEDTSSPVKSVDDSESWDQKQTANVQTDWNAKNSNHHDRDSGSDSRLERFTKSSSIRQAPNVKLELPNTDKIEWFSPPPVRSLGLRQQW